MEFITVLVTRAPLGDFDAEHASTTPCWFLTLACSSHRRYARSIGHAARTAVSSVDCSDCSNASDRFLRRLCFARRTYAVSRHRCRSQRALTTPLQIAPSIRRRSSVRRHRFFRHPCDQTRSRHDGFRVVTPSSRNVFRHLLVHRRRSPLRSLPFRAPRQPLPSTFAVESAPARWSNRLATSHLATHARSRRPGFRQSRRSRCAYRSFRSDDATSARTPNP